MRLSDFILNVISLRVCSFFRVNILLDMLYITLYLAISWQFLVPVTGSRNFSSVVYGGLQTRRTSPITRHNGAPIKHPAKYDSAVEIQGVPGGPQLAIHDAESHASLGQLYVWSLFFF